MQKIKVFLGTLLHHRHCFDSRWGIEVLPELGYTLLKCRCGREKLFYGGVR